MDTAASDARVSLALGDLADLDLTVSVVPYLSVFAAIADAVAGIRPGLPRRLAESVRTAVGDRGRQAFSPLASSPSSMVPDCLIPVTPRQDISGAEALERLFAVSPDDVARDVAAEFGADASGRWRPAIERPREWIRACAESAVAVSQCLHPLWRDAGPLLERERRRVDVAVSRGSPLLVLQQLSPRLRVVAGRLTFRDVDGGSYDLAGRRLVLTPLLSGPGMLMANFDAGDVVWIGYPLPGVTGLFKGRGWVPDDDRLSLLLGEPRRTLLLYLTRPCGMSEAASVMHTTGATATFHVGRLESMGLVRRRRRGQEVTISRTERGDELIALMGRDA